MIIDKDKDKIHELDMRLTVLEIYAKDTMKITDHHDGLIDKLSEQSTEMTLALNDISSKFDKLISQFATGFKIISAGFIVITTLVGAFWTYQQSIDAHSVQQHTQIIERVVK